jgi:hypothetical protein
MPPWNAYPPDYRSKEVRAILDALRAGECVSVVGLSGAGKSNLLGFMAHHPFTLTRAVVPARTVLTGTVAPEGEPGREVEGPALRLVDCNRLAEPTPWAFFDLVVRSLQVRLPSSEQLLPPVEQLESALCGLLDGLPGPLGLLFDRFDALPGAVNGPVTGGLRALRDVFKYNLAYVTATRRPLPEKGELAELFYAHTLWLGPLSEPDARWSAGQYLTRQNLGWDEGLFQQLLAFSGGYPSFLRACCEAYAAGCPLELEALRAHPALQRRLAEFWADAPSPEDLRRSGLAGLPLLALPPAEPVDEAGLTAKEHRLLGYLQAHPGQVCEKDDLIRAVWTEDRVIADGIRDDSLAQLVRRLRRKIEADPANPRLIHSVPGRGYRYKPGEVENR